MAKRTVALLLLAAGCGKGTAIGTCPDGLESRGGECVDIDECAADNGGCGDARFWTCTNEVGAPPACADVDECATDNGDCGDAAFWTCTNNVGAPPSCADIDECATDNGGCGDAAVWECIDAAGAAPDCDCRVAGTPHHLAIDVAPEPDAGVNRTWPAFALRVEDACGALADGASATVTLTVAAGTGTLSGTLARAAAGGVAMFDDIAYDVAEAVTLDAASDGLAGVTGLVVHVSGWTGLAGSELASWQVHIASSATNGGVSASLDPSVRPSLALDSAARPVVAWQEPLVGASEIFLRRWDGAAWVAVGGSTAPGGVSATADASAYPSVAVDSQDRIVVAWEEFVGGTNYETYVVRWNGAWEELGGSATGGGVSNTAGKSRYPVAGIGALDAPVVAWFEDYAVHLRVWNADTAAWEELGGSATGGGVSGTTQVSTAFDFSMAMTRAGAPTLAWGGFAGGESRAFVRRWDGAGWAELGGSGTSGVAFEVSDVALALDGDDRPIIAWNDFVSGGSPGSFWSEIYVARWDGSAWVGVPGALGSSPVSAMQAVGLAAFETQLAVTASGDPVVAWTGLHVDRPGEIFLARWNGAGSTWEGLAGSMSGGGLTANAGPSAEAALVVVGDAPALAWADGTSGGTEIYYRSWSGSAWVESHGNASGGGVSNTPRSSVRPALALDDAGHPALAWRDGDAPSRAIFLARFDGAGWQALGGSMTPPALGAASYNAHASLALDGDLPVVTWHGDRTGANTEVYLSRYAADAWSGLAGTESTGGVSDSPDMSREPAVAVCGAGRPVVAWLESTQALRVLGWDGAAWTGFGASGTTGISTAVAQYQGETPLSLACDSLDRPVVAFTRYYQGNQDVHLLRWDGAQWVGLGGSDVDGGLSNTGGRSQSPVVALDAGDRPIVAWQDETSGRWQVYLRAWDGAAWIELAGSGSSGGVSASSGQAGAVSLAIDGSGRPVLAWADTAEGNPEIYMRRFGAGRWEQVAGSASAGGVSNSSGRSDAPAVAVNGATLCVAWQEGGATSLEIVARCHHR